MVTEEYGPQPGSAESGGSAALLQSAITTADAFTASVDALIARIIGEVNAAIAAARDDALEMLGLEVPQQYGPLNQPGETPTEEPVDTIVDETLGETWSVETVGKKKAGTTNSALGNMLDMRALRTDVDKLKPDIEALQAQQVITSINITRAKTTADKALDIANAALSSVNNVRSNLYHPAEHNRPSDKYTISEE
jgi:hypothetical protein